jgi:hypothetical protein
MATFTQDFFTSRRNQGDGTTRIGDTGRLWYDPSTNTIRVSDGVTPGGIIVSGGSGSSAVAAYQNTPPSSAVNGSLWFNPDTEFLYVYSAGVWEQVTINPDINTNLAGGTENQILVKKSATNYDFDWEDMIINFPPTNYTKLLDQYSSTILYLGEALPETLETSPLWRIQRIIFDASGEVDEVRFANGGEFNQIWTNRYSLVYF